jgi:hypothetical protein
MIKKFLQGLEYLWTAAQHQILHRLGNGRFAAEKNVTWAEAIVSLFRVVKVFGTENPIVDLLDNNFSNYLSNISSHSDELWFCTATVRLHHQKPDRMRSGFCYVWRYWEAKSLRGSVRAQEVCMLSL